MSIKFNIHYEKIISKKDSFSQEKMSRPRYGTHSYFQEPDQSLYKAALESLRTQIRSSTTSMTSVPKPLKFLRPHYDTLKGIYETIKDNETKVHSYSSLTSITVKFSCESH